MKVNKSAKDMTKDEIIDELRSQILLLFGNQERLRRRLELIIEQEAKLEGELELWKSHLEKCDCNIQ